MLIAPPQHLIVEAGVFAYLPQTFCTTLRRALSLRVMLTDVARKELRLRYKNELFETAILRSELEVVSLVDITDFHAAYALQSMGLGMGEAVSIVAAHRYGAAVALDDALAIRHAKRTYPSVPLMETQEIVELCDSVGKLHDVDQLTEAVNSHAVCKSPNQSKFPAYKR